MKWRNKHFIRIEEWGWKTDAKKLIAIIFKIHVEAHQTGIHIPALINMQSAEIDISVLLYTYMYYWYGAEIDISSFVLTQLWKDNINQVYREKHFREICVFSHKWHEIDDPINEHSWTSVYEGGGLDHCPVPKRKVLWVQCRHNVGPTSQTLAQHCASTGPGWILLHTIVIYVSV